MLRVPFQLTLQAVREAGIDRCVASVCCGGWKRRLRRKNSWTRVKVLLPQDLGRITSLSLALVCSSVKWERSIKAYLIGPLGRSHEVRCLKGSEGTGGAWHRTRDLSLLPLLLSVSRPVAPAFLLLAGPGVREEALSFTRWSPKPPAALDSVPTPPVQRYSSLY